MRVAVLRCEKLPSFVTWDIPNVEDLFSDDRLLIAEFARRGIGAESVVWGDPSVDWDTFDVALIRSTWDYIDERERFLEVLATVNESSCRLYNPLRAVRWNSNKSYLFDLRDWHVPIVPTHLASTSNPAVLQAAMIQRGWQSAVLKPIVGAGGADVRKVPAQELATTLEQLSGQQSLGQILVQPLIESVQSEGEWSFIYIDGTLSHVLLKKPAPGDYRAHGIYGGSIECAEPLPGDLQQVEGILTKLPFDLLYARLDLVRIDDQLAIMELELVEPILYFNLAPGSVDQLVSATISRLGRPAAGLDRPER